MSDPHVAYLRAAADQLTGAARELLRLAEHGAMPTDVAAAQAAEYLAHAVDLYSRVPPAAPPRPPAPEPFPPPRAPK